MTWWHWSQNNSGGKFIKNEILTCDVFIEADSLKEAEDKAFEMGIYYNGVEVGRDCECCGDRWDSPYEVKEDVRKYAKERLSWGERSKRLFYKNGKIEEME